MLACRKPTAIVSRLRSNRCHRTLAGAHLAAMLACRSAQDANLMGGRIQHVSLVSGIFELESLIGTRMNEHLGLTPLEIPER